MWHGSVIARGLNLRPAPGTGNDPLTVLATGARFEVLDDDAAPGWFRVWAGGREGFLFGSSSYVRSERTTEADLVVVQTPHPTSRPVLLHRRAATGFAVALASVSGDDARALCRVNRSFSSWASQEAMIRSYEAAIGTKWIPWSKLNAGQLVAAKAAGFAYHPGFPVDAPHTHVGGGAMDIQAPLPAAASAALASGGFRQDTKGDAVHWAWHG